MAKVIGIISLILLWEASFNSIDHRIYSFRVKLADVKRDFCNKRSCL